MVNLLSYELRSYRGAKMLRNNIELDLKTRFIEGETTQKALA